MGEVVLVQHCQSEHHVNQMSGGWTDTPLTGLGRQQAHLIADRLKEHIDSSEYLLYSSDLLRASQTAGIIGSRLELSVIEHSGLREINTGVASGKTKDWARAHRNPRADDVFDLDYQEFHYGETWRQFYRRVSTSMQSLFGADKTQNFLIVTHGGTIAYITAWWLHFSEEMLACAYFSSSPASISILSRNSFGQNVLESFNDTAHLSLLE